jgi:hypothetical protein
VPATLVSASQSVENGCLLKVEGWWWKQLSYSTLTFANDTIKTELALQNGLRTIEELGAVTEALALLRSWTSALQLLEDCTCDGVLC